VLRIGDAYPGSELPIPHQRILTQKNVSKLLEKCSGIFFPDPGSRFFPIPDPGSRSQKGTGFRIPNIAFIWCFPEELSGEETDSGLGRQMNNSRRASDGLVMI
jgi:hypothetical protein